MTQPSPTELATVLRDMVAERPTSSVKGEFPITLSQEMARRIADALEAVAGETAEGGRHNHVLSHCRTAAGESDVHQVVAETLERVGEELCRNPTLYVARVDQIGQGILEAARRLRGD